MIHNDYIDVNFSLKRQEAKWLKYHLKDLLRNIASSDHKIGCSAVVRLLGELERKTWHRVR